MERADVLSSTTKNILTKQKNTYNIFVKYIFYPVRAGLIGFSMFFTAVIAAKYVGHLIHSEEFFSVDYQDALISLVGFVLVFLIRFLENFKKDEKPSVI